MWIRLATMLLCIVFFITGCNSLLSQFFGTHKLRAFEMPQVVNEGIGDADYIEVAETWQTGDYIVVPKINAGDKPIVIFPLLTNDQLSALEKGQRVTPKVIGWTKEFDLACDDTQTCADRGERTVTGVVRRMRRAKNKTASLPVEKYELTDDVYYVEVGRHPIAWYWNLLMIVGGLGLAFIIENRASKRRRKEEDLVVE